MSRLTDTAARHGSPPGGPAFLSAEDFDVTGILAGVEPCASSYWWIPELQAEPAAAPEAAVEIAAPAPLVPATPRRQAARRAPSRSGTAAA
ncbi:MAG: hypothetical protein ACKO5R_03870 [Planctomycetaceae bacterium]